MAVLNVRTIEAIRPRDKPFKITIDRGLQLRVAPRRSSHTARALHRQGSVRRTPI